MISQRNHRRRMRDSHLQLNSASLWGFSRDTIAMLLLSTKRYFNRSKDRENSICLTISELSETKTNRAQNAQKQRLQLKHKIRERADFQHIKAINS